MFAYCKLVCELLVPCHLVFLLGVSQELIRKMGLSTGHSPIPHLSSEADPAERTFTVTQTQMSYDNCLKNRNWVIPAVIFM